MSLFEGGGGGGVPEVYTRKIPKCSIIMMIAMTLFNIVCPDPEEAGKAVVIVSLVALEDQFVWGCNGEAWD